jgi:hypothetical protein
MCLAFTIQVGNSLSTFFIFSLFFSSHSEIGHCVIFNIRVGNSQLQGYVLLIISVTRFMKFFFPTTYNKMNHFVIGYIIKFSIVLVPVYLQFVTGHACGLDVFCPKDLRRSINILTYTETSKYQNEIIALTLQNFACRANIYKIFFPITVLIILVPSICILIKLLTQNFVFSHPFFIPPTSTEEPPIELRTISSTVESPPSTPTSDAPSYSVGLITGLLTILGIILNQFNLVLSLYFKANILHFMLIELLFSIVIPLCWFLANPKIIALGG